MAALKASLRNGSGSISQLSVRLRTVKDLKLDVNIVSGFAAYLNHLGEEAGEWKLQTVNICGSGGTDLTATTVAKELGSTEIQVWNGARGGMTCDPPTIYGRAIPQPYLTFKEAEEIMFFDRQSMLLAREGCISIKVKNLSKPEAPGTLITKTRDMSKSMLTSIVLKSNIIMLDIKSKMVPAQTNFVARCYSTFESESIIVECVASSGDRMSVIVASSKQSARDLVNMEVGTLVEKLGKFADVNPLERSIISLVGNAQESPTILQKTFDELAIIDVKVQMMGQLSAKEDEQVTNVSFLVKDSEAECSVRALHSLFFPVASFVRNNYPDPMKSSAAASRRSLIRGSNPFSVKTSAFSQKKPEQTTEPVRSAQDDGRKFDCVMDIGAAKAQPEKPVDVPTDIRNAVHDLSSSVLREVGDGNSSVKEVDEDALKDIEHPPGTAYSLDLGQQALAPYPPPAAGHPNAHKGQAFSAQEKIYGKVQMLGQLPAEEDEQVKTVSFYVKDSEAECSKRAVQSELFELNRGNSFVAASSSGKKRKMDEDHPEAPPSMRQLQMAGTDPSVVQERTDGSDLEETEHTAFSGMDADQAMLYNIPDKNTFEPDVSAMEFDELLNSLIESPPVAQPEHTFGSGMDFSSGDFGTHPDVGEGCSGTPNVLDDTEHSCHSVKKADHNSLKNIEYRKLDDNPFSMPANCQRYGGGYPLQPNPLGMGHHTSAPYPLPATGYHTSAGVDNSPGTGGDDSGGYPPPGGDYSPLFNEDECKNLDGKNNYICNKEDWPIL